MTSSRLAVLIRCSAFGRALDGVLDALGRVMKPAEILLVDEGASTLFLQQRLARLQQLGMAVVRTSRGDRGSLANVGANTSSLPYVALLDGGSPVDLERSVRILEERPHAGLVIDEALWMPEISTDFWASAPEWAGGLPLPGQRGLMVFRRSVWATIGGFDEALGELAVWDFMLSASARGIQWAALRPATMRARTHRPACRLDSIRQIYVKHAATIDRVAKELFLAKEAARLALEAETRRLERSSHDLEREAGEIQHRLDIVGRELAASGRSRIDWGDLRRLTPVSSIWGLDRGGPVDRYYIENFLERHRTDITGRVLEIKDTGYTDRYGGGVTQADALDVDRSNHRATIVADLTKGDGIPSDTFDCFVLTQTLHIIYDIRAALSNAYRILKPGGVLLCTLPSVSRINDEDGGLDHGDFWRFTDASVRRLFAELFPLASFEVAGFGNVMACTAFLYGLSPEELTQEELDFVDPWFPLIFCVRAAKPAPDRQTIGMGTDPTALPRVEAELSSSQTGSIASASAPRSAHIEGFLEVVSCDQISGWAWDRSQPDSPVTIDIYDGDHLLITTLADRFRADLVDARKGNGRHHFAQSTPTSIRDGRPHSIGAVVKGSTFTLTPLQDVPVSITCAEPAELGRSRSSERILTPPGTHVPRKVSIVIPYHEVDHIERRLQSLVVQTFRDFDIIVVDDGSTDSRPVEFLSGTPWLEGRVIHAADHSERAAACNFAVDRSSAEYLCTLNGDGLPEPEFLKEAVKLLDADRSLAFVSCPLQATGGDQPISSEVECKLATLLRGPDVGSAVLTRRSTIGKLGGYDEKMPVKGYEDWELQIRLLGASLRGRIMEKPLFRPATYSKVVSGIPPDVRVSLMRYVVSRHESAYREHLFELLLHSEGITCELLKENYALEYEIDGRLMQMVAERRERVARLRQARDQAVENRR